MKCTRCNRRKPVLERKECKSCLEYSKRKAKQWRAKRTKVGGCVQCCCKAQKPHTVCRKHLLKFRASSMVHWAALKKETFEHYSNGKCCWPKCLVVDPDMLTLDHKENDGAKQRRKKRRLGVVLYQMLKKKKWPIGYQVLCCNHQMKKELMRRRGVNPPRRVDRA